MSEQKFIPVAKNKKAFHEFEIFDKYEAGIELKGTEIKSIREHRVNLKDSFCLVKNGQVTVHNMHISPYDFGNIFNHDPTRIRRLLLHKKEILKLADKLAQKGLTLIPISLYIKGKRAKLEIALAKGKKLHDKRESLREKDIKRDMDREIKNYRT